MSKPLEIVEAAQMIAAAEREVERAEKALVPLAAEARGVEAALAAARTQLREAGVRLTRFLGDDASDEAEAEAKPRPRPGASAPPALPDAEMERLRGRIVCAKLQTETIKGKLEWWNSHEFILVGDTEVLDTSSRPDPGDSSGWMTVVRLGPGGSRRLSRNIPLGWRK